MPQRSSIRRLTRRIEVGLLALTLSGLVTLPTPAAATILCGAKDRTTGQLRDGASLKVRSVCRANEVQASAAALGLSPPGVVVRTGSQISTGGSLSTPANCDPGEVATGGGALTSVTGGAEITVRSSRPQPETAGAVPIGWRVSAANLNAPTGTITVTAYVVCATP